MANFQATEEVRDDLRVVRFSYEVDGERVPGALWMPAEADEAMPLVFIQHPGTSSKDDYFVTEPGQRWARRDWICAGLDAPMHGDRDDFDPMGLFRERELYPVIAAQFAAELTAGIDHLAERYPVDMSRLGYVGFSMGSMLGIPAVATDGRFKAAAFCLVGEGGFVGPATGDDSHVPALAKVAVRIVGKENDELVPRAATESLFEAIEGEKDLVWLPGGHFEIGPDVIDKAGEWLKRHLG
jgi:predicted esterase